MLRQAFCSRGIEAYRANLSPQEDFKNHDTSMLGWVQSQSLLFLPQRKNWTK